MPYAIKTARKGRKYSYRSSASSGIKKEEVLAGLNEMIRMRWRCSAQTNIIAEADIMALWAGQKIA